MYEIHTEEIQALARKLADELVNASTRATRRRIGDDSEAGNALCSAVGQALEHAGQALEHAGQALEHACGTLLPGDSPEGDRQRVGGLLQDLLAAEPVVDELAQLLEPRPGIEIDSVALIREVAPPGWRPWPTEEHLAGFLRSFMVAFHAAAAQDEILRRLIKISLLGEIRVDRRTVASWNRQPDTTSGGRDAVPPPPLAPAAHHPVLDRRALQERLRGIEWTDFEVKAATGGVPSSAYETVSAFANSEGGWLVFGASETAEGFKITGLTDPDALQGSFIAACRSPEKISTRLDVQGYQYVVEGATILAFYVAPASRFDKPVRVRLKRQWASFVRVGGSDYRCSVEEEGRFLRDAAHESFDSTVCEGLTEDDLDPEAIQRFRRMAQHLGEPAEQGPEITDFLRARGLVLRTGELRHAAALAFGREGVLAELKPGGVVDFRRIAGDWAQRDPADRWDDRKLMERNLMFTLTALLEHLHQLTPHPFAWEPNGIQHTAESLEYRAIREALVNLLIHQDYADRHRTARLLWYRDRVIFDNPGDSFVSLGQLLNGGGSQMRNPILVRLFRQAGVAEQAGTGIPNILKNWRKAGRIPPEIGNDPARKTFRLVFHWQSQKPAEGRHATLTTRYRTAAAAVHGTLRFVGFADHRPRPNVQVPELYVPLRLEPRGRCHEGEAKIGTTQDLLARLLQRGDPTAARIIVLGDPGSGKSTLCRFATVVLAGAAPMDGAEVEEEILPLLLPFRDYVRSIREGHDCTLIDFLTDQAAAQLQIAISRELLEKALDDGRAVLLLDGLDEVGAAAEREEMRGRVQAFCRLYPRMPALVTSRSAGYEDAPLPHAGPDAFRLMTLVPWSDQDLRQFASRWYAVREPADLQARDRGIADFVAVLDADSRLRELAYNPMLATQIALCQAHPGERAALYDVCVRTLLDTWPEGRRTTFREIDARLQRSYLETLAYRMQLASSGAGDVEIERNALITALVEIVRERGGGAATEKTRAVAERWIGFLEQGAGLLVERRPGGFAFFHPSLREYLAACGMDAAEVAEEVIAQRFRDPAWQEICLLAVGRRAAEKAFPDRLFATLREAEEGPSFLLRCLREEAAFDADQCAEVLLRAGRDLLGRPPESWERDRQTLDEVLRFSIRHAQWAQGWIRDSLASATGEDLRGIVALTGRTP